jgi:hypothetical protein
MIEAATTLAFRIIFLKTTKSKDSNGCPRAAPETHTKIEAILFCVVLSAVLWLQNLKHACCVLSYLCCFVVA